MQTLEEFGDVYKHFLLYYGTDIPKMNAWSRAKLKKKKQKKEEEGDGEGGEEPKKEEEEEEVPEDGEGDTLKQASRKSGYTICAQAGLGKLFSNKFLHINS